MFASQVTEVQLRRCFNAKAFIAKCADLCHLYNFLKLSFRHREITIQKKNKHPPIDLGEGDKMTVFHKLTSSKAT